MTVILLLGVVALIFAIGITALGAMAGDEGASAQHAADAAALAGAQGVLDDAPVSLRGGFQQPTDSALLLGGGTCVQTGRAQATNLAAANGATLTAYCFNVWRDEVTASVTMNATQVSGPPATARAKAASSFDASSCRLAGDFQSPVPRPTPSATPSVSPRPAPPPAPVATSIDCGFGPLPILFDPVALRFHFRGLAAALADRKPRLTH